MMNKITGTALSLTFSVLMSYASLVSNSRAAENNIVTVKVEGDFIDVSSNERAAVIGKGINIAHVLPASEMPHRTSPAFGY